MKYFIKDHIYHIGYLILISLMSIFVGMQGFYIELDPFLAIYEFIRCIVISSIYIIILHHFNLAFRDDFGEAFLIHNWFIWIFFFGLGFLFWNSC